MENTEENVIKKVVTETLKELYVRAEKRGGHPINYIDDVLDGLEKAIGKNGVDTVVSMMILKGFGKV